MLMRLYMSRPLAAVAAMVALGAALGLSFEAPPMALIVAAALILAACVMLRGRAVIAVALMFAALWAGIASVSVAMMVHMPPPEGEYDIVLTISGEVTWKGQRASMTAAPDVTIDGEAIGSPVMLFVNDYSNPEEFQALPLAYGTRLRMRARLWHPQPRRNPGGFDYRAYLWQKGVNCCISVNAADVIIESQAGPSLMDGIMALRIRLAQVLDEVFPEDCAALMRAMLLGDKSALPEEVAVSFRDSGIAHLLAVSGLNAALLAGLLFGLLTLLRCSGMLRMGLLIGFLMLYALMTGMGASVLRAGLMLVAVLGAPMLGRHYDGLTGLSAAFLLLMAINPLMAADIGFVLSFSAVAGLVLLTPTFHRLARLGPESAEARDGSSLERLRDVRSWPGRAWRYVRQLICSSLAAQLATLPAVATYFHTIPLMATLTNLVAIPAIGVALPIGFVSMLLGLLSVPLARVVALPAIPFLQLVIWSSEKIAQVRGMIVQTGRWPGLLILGFAVLVALASPHLRLSFLKRAVALAMLPVMAVGIALFSALTSVEPPEVIFLDAGQADAAIIRAGRSTYMVDVGGPDTPALDTLSYYGRMPEAVFISHPHDDHAAGLMRLLDYAPPKVIYLPVGWRASEMDSASFAALTLAEQMGIPLITLKAGDTVRLAGGLTMEVYAPVSDAGDGDTQERVADGNELSQMLLLKYGERGASVLFTGDLPAGAEPLVMPPATVLKAAHHGARLATSERMLHAARPGLMVISVGRLNSFGHPSPEVLARAEKYGARVLRTDRSGAVTVKLLPDGGVRAETIFEAEAS